MRRIIILLAGLLAIVRLQPASAEESVFIGRATANVYTGVDPSCAGDSCILMSTWYRWTIKVTAKLSGPDLPRVIVAARLQHAGLVSGYMRRITLFVVSPIEDLDTRKRLRADYVLDDQSNPVTMHCLYSDPRKLGLDVGQVFVNDSGRYCFELPQGPQ